MFFGYYMLGDRVMFFLLGSGFHGYSTLGERVGGFWLLPLEKCSMFFPLEKWVSWLLPAREEGICFLVTTCLVAGLCSSCWEVASMVTLHWGRGCMFFGYYLLGNKVMFFLLGNWVPWLLNTGREGECFLVTQAGGDG